MRSLVACVFVSVSVAWMGVADVPAVAGGHVEQFARLVTQLAAIPEGEGRLPDPTILFCGWSISDGPVHDPDNLPILLAGETNETPGYEMLGRLFAAGYLRGLMQAARPPGQHPRGQMFAAFPSI